MCFGDSFHMACMFWRALTATAGADTSRLGNLLQQTAAARAELSLQFPKQWSLQVIPISEDRHRSLYNVSTSLNSL